MVKKEEKPEEIERDFPLFVETFQTKSERIDVCLDPRKPLAIEYRHQNWFESVTVADSSTSLIDMVSTGTVGLNPPSVNVYRSPNFDFENDDEAHESEDYQKLNDADIVDKTEFLDRFANDPRNKEQSPPEVQPKVEEPPKVEKPTPAKE